MPHIEYQIAFARSWADISRFNKAKSRTDHLTNWTGVKAEDTDLEVLVNNDDWSFCNVFEGVRITLSSSGLPAADEGNPDETYSARIRCSLSWEQARGLHNFLAYLLSQQHALALSADNAAHLASMGDQADED